MPALPVESACQRERGFAAAVAALSQRARLSLPLKVPRRQAQRAMLVPPAANACQRVRDFAAAVVTPSQQAIAAHPFQPLLPRRPRQAGSAPRVAEFRQRARPFVGTVASRWLPPRENSGHSRLPGGGPEQ